MVEGCRAIRSRMGDCHDFLLFVVISQDLNLKIWKKYRRPGRDVRSVFLTEFRTRVEGVTVPHTRPDCTSLVFTEATKDLYTTRAHVTKLFVEPIKTFWFFQLALQRDSQLERVVHSTSYIIRFFLR